MIENKPIVLKKSVIEQIRANQRLRNRLQFELDKSSKTIYRWLSDNCESLTTAKALRIISEELGVDQSKLLSN